LLGLFKSELQYLYDGRLVWHYWPKEFYDGWDASDNLSDNTPTKTLTIDYLFEDLSHAGFNIAFIIHFNEMFLRMFLA
jgi:hypothetical protein